MTRRIAVVGGGLTGLFCAAALLEAGHASTVFDKGRAPGGRLATRRIGPFQFDMGAQYFTVEDPAFADVVSAWRVAGVCAPWTGRIGATDGPGAGFHEPRARERFVGAPGMSALGRHLARDLDVRPSHRVDAMERVGDRFVLHGRHAPGETVPPADEVPTAPDVRHAFGEFDAVVVCLPANQAAPLVAPVSPALAARAHDVVLGPCFALGLASAADEGLRAVPFDGVFVGRDGDAHATSPIAWVARDSSKPGRPPGEQWVVHARADWSRASYADEPGAVRDALLDAFAALFGLPSVAPVTTTLLRWGFAKATAPLTGRALLDGTQRLVVGGDWAGGGRIEGAFLSGRALAEAILA